MNRKERYLQLYIRLKDQVGHGRGWIFSDFAIALTVGFGFTFGSNGPYLAAGILALLYFIIGWYSKARGLRQYEQNYLSAMNPAMNRIEAKLDELLEKNKKKRLNA